MTCAEVERVLPDLLDDSAEGGLPNAFESHLRSCPDCSGLIADLKTIAASAREMADVDDPPQRVWVRIAAELRAEGVIRDVSMVPTRISRPSRSWWSVPVAAVIIAAGAYLVNHPSTPQVANKQQNLPQSAASTTAQPTPAPQVASVDARPINSAQPSSVVSAHQPQPESTLATAPSMGAPSAIPARLSEPGPSGISSGSDDQQFLSVVSTRAPTMRATYEKQLATVNANIRDVQAYLDRNPDDADARQQLMDAYEQKSLLYQIALDRIQ